jgi:hypothetical protein
MGTDIYIKFTPYTLHNTHVFTCVMCMVYDSHPTSASIVVLVEKP